MRARVDRSSTRVAAALLLAAVPFGTEGRAQEESLAAGACVADATTLCISDGPGDNRFRITVDWSTVQGDQSGKGNAVPIASVGFSRGGIFWFFSSANPEMLVKVLNGCSVNQMFWVFTSAGTNVGLLTTVTDTVTGAVKSYTSPDLTPAMPVQDVTAFPCGTGYPSETTVYLPGNVPLVMVRVPSGTFQMGAPASERSSSSSEQPVHQVTLTSDYYVGKYEVTQGQWRALMGAAPDLGCSGQTRGVGDSHPAYCVSWTDIARPGGFVDTLNSYLAATGQPGAGKFRLPTEAEWERAARGGTQTRFSFGDALGGDDTCGSNAEASPYVWWCASSGGVTHPVGSRAANPYGLHDVHGNVFEWVSDWYGSYSSAPQWNPTGPATGSYRVFRGGRWNGYLWDSRSAYRYPYAVSPSSRSETTGFRLARSL